MFIQNFQKRAYAGILVAMEVEILIKESSPKKSDKDYAEGLKNVYYTMLDVWNKKNTNSPIKYCVQWDDKNIKDKNVNKVNTKLDNTMNTIMDNLSSMMLDYMQTIIIYNNIKVQEAIITLS